jgi:hypothetical protein
MGMAKYEMRSTNDEGIAMPPFLEIGSLADRRIIQILSAINYRFLGPNSR